MFALNYLAVLALGLFGVATVLAQEVSYRTARSEPPPSAILSPTRKQEFAYGGILPFSYNYTYDTTLESYPVVDVLLGRRSDSSAFEVALGLNCKDNVCENGVLKLEIDLAKWGRFLGLGTIQLQTVERMSTIVDDQLITSRRTTARVDFIISFEPMIGMVDYSAGMRMQWN